MERTPCALTIAGSDSGGGAGVQADLATFRALGVHGACVLTALTAQNTLGVRGILEVPPEFVERQLEAVLEDLPVEWGKTGMLYTEGVRRAVASAARRHGLKLVVDPVRRASTGAELSRGGMEELLAVAEVVTPNVPEAEELSGLRIRSVEEMRKAAEKIVEKGAKAVLLKGGHLRGPKVRDLFYRGGRVRIFEAPRLPSSFHGTGCILSAALTAELAKGKRMEEAVEGALAFLRGLLGRGRKVGKGDLLVLDPVLPLREEAEKGRAVEEVWRAAQLLCSEPRFASLLPEVGTNVAMVPEGAKELSQVVGLSGRIVRVEGRPHLTGFPRPGGSEHVARLVLTASFFDPSLRAGLNLRFSPSLVEACRRLGLEVGEFRREEEPRGRKTMEWAVKYVAEKRGRVPRVIVDRGGKGKEAMVRLLGRTPTEVAELALRLLREVEEREG
ncbi:MAG: bifunctional hydroxymethylpyrimidine kinase/phosphomethylpyrimidine kinase [Candidatus Hadarchaeales archaeon]